MKKPNRKRQRDGSLIVGESATCSLQEVAKASKVKAKEEQQAVDIIANDLLQGAAAGEYETGQSNILISRLNDKVKTLEKNVLQTLAEKDNEIMRIETFMNQVIAGMKEDLQKNTKTLEARDAEIEQLKLQEVEHKKQIEHLKKSQATSEKDSNAVKKKTENKVKVSDECLESCVEEEFMLQQLAELKRKNEMQEEQINRLKQQKQFLQTFAQREGILLARNERLRKTIHCQIKDGKEKEKRERKAFTKLVSKLRSKLRSQIDNSKFLKSKLAELDSEKEAPFPPAQKPTACKTCTKCKSKKQCKKIAKWNRKQTAIASTSQTVKKNLSLAEHQGKPAPLITGGLEKDQEGGCRQGGRGRGAGFRDHSLSSENTQRALASPPKIC